MILSPRSPYSAPVSKITQPQFVPNRPLVCVQGLGFVGAAMATAVAAARDERGEPRYSVKTAIGLT